MAFYKKKRSGRVVTRGFHAVSVSFMRDRTDSLESIVWVVCPPTHFSNHAIVYRRQWMKYLEKVIGVPMSEVDAFIVGKFNGYKEAENTSFYNDMLELVVNYEDASLTNPPPTMWDFAQAYSGPIVGHSMFADWGNNYLHIMDMVHDMDKIHRKNVRLVEGRHYVPQLGECGAKKAGELGTCDEDKSAHRCMGARGGHPDLIAWDIIEAVNDLLVLE